MVGVTERRLDDHWGSQGQLGLCDGGQGGSRWLWRWVWLTMGTLMMARARNGMCWTVAGSWGIREGRYSGARSSLGKAGSPCALWRRSLGVSAAVVPAIVQYGYVEDD